MEAAILCGGEGTRLRPLTYFVPKPLLPFGSKPILEVILNRLKEQGFRKFYLMVDYKADMIRDYFRNGESLGADIEYIKENTSRGTAGPLSALKNKITSPLVVMNGDLLTDLNFCKMMEFHNTQNADLTIALKKYQRKISYGIADIDSESHIIQLREKPELTYLISSGIYILSPHLLSLIPEEGKYLMTDFIERMIAEGMNVLGYTFTEAWHDIGRLDDYMKSILNDENLSNDDRDRVLGLP
ncbi:MAG: sugar phosphate nucleotidyltransferase [Candidatus Sifarchaeia archaeon]